MLDGRWSQRSVRWTVAGLYTASIFLLAPFVPKLWDFLTYVLTNEGAIRTVNRAVPVVGVVAVASILFVVRARRPSGFASTSPDLPVPQSRAPNDGRSLSSERQKPVSQMRA